MATITTEALDAVRSDAIALARETDDLGGDVPRLCDYLTDREAENTASVAAVGLRV